MAALAFGAGIRAAGAQTISYYGLPDDIGSGLQSNIIRAQLSDSQHGGITVRIESADTTLAFISDAAQNPGAQFVDVFLPNGTVNADFWVQTVPDTVGTATLIATAPGFASAVDSVNILTPAIRLMGLSGVADVNGVYDDFIVQTGLPTPGQTTLTAIQAASARGSGLTATVRNSNAAAGQLVTNALTDQVVTSVVLPGQSSTPSTIPLGGVAFDGTAGGVTEITASIPGFIATTADTGTVTVFPSSLTFAGLDDEVGSGLQTDFQVVNLSAPAHGGVNVHIEPDDTTMVLLSTGFSVPGQSALDVFVPDGLGQVFFYVHGLEGVTGSTAITASAPGFGTTVDTIQVVTPGLEITNLSSTFGAFDSNQLFRVRVGLPESDNSELKQNQWARAGGPGFTVTVASSDSTVAVLVTNSITGDVVTAPIAPTNNATPSTVASGGVALDPVSPGSTQITGFIPDFVVTSAGSLDVTVTQPAIAIGGIPTRGVGSGLQSSYAAVSLGATEHGGVNVQIVSTEPEIALISAHPDSVGRDTTNVFVTNGNSSAYFYIHGVEDTTGTVTLTASAFGFTPGNSPVDIVQPVVGILASSLGSTLDTIDPPDEFRVNVGVPNATTIFLQNVRAGSPGIPVTAMVDDSTLATMVTLTDTSAAATVIVPAGSANSNATVAGGGIALDGLNPGTVTVSASAPGFGTVATSPKTVIINAPFLNIPFFQDIGSGLQSPAIVVSLSASAHGGVTVHMESQDSTVALVATGETDLGTPGADVFVPDGTAAAVFYVHGVDDTTGTVPIVVSAPQFLSDTTTATIVQPGVDIYSLSPTIGVGDPDDEFRARVGVPAAGNLAVAYPQKRRGGALPLVVGVTSSDTTAAHLNTLSESGDSVTVLIDPGEFWSPLTVASGGVSLEAVGEGQTMVFASIPGFIQTGDAQLTVDVEDETISFVSLPTALGVDLETNVVTAQLGNGNHGGITVHIAVDDTANTAVSSSALALGGPTVDIPLLNGETDAAFYLQAAGAGDSVQVTASATGFTNAVGSVLIVPAGLAIDLLPDTVGVADPDTAFVVQLGAVLGDNSGILETQLLRPGVPAVPITVTSSDAPVGALTTSSTTGDVATVTINPGEGQSPLTVAGGGVAFDPLRGGLALIHAAATGFVATEAGSLIVVVPGVVGIPDDPVPTTLRLEPSAPNPFTQSTTIRFAVSKSVRTRLAVFDIRGRHVATLLDQTLPAGPTEVTWHGRDQLGRRMSPGVYFYRLAAGRDVRTMKTILLK